ncbi:DNA polymerase Y family protein [Chelativorans sp. Marseille-P2723]|uniref:Y-family DNA polymerase n=1 Tax=Chelativorans sp. Marseille-P2723 TaxID=2709133 RepID=UPI001FF05D0B|nr:DNA polymerase Y family protein [Chelativorans sp. Marseille-P2723]
MRRRHGAEWRRGGKEGKPVEFPPLVVSRREANAQHIAALDEQAEALGLRPGIGIADARAMHPGIEVVEEEPEADRRLLESLADWCDRYTPLVALEGTNGLFLDISGCAHLFGGEDAMLAEIVRRLAHQGFDARAGLASTPGMAWAAARFLEGQRRNVPQGEEEEFLAPMPLAALRLEEKIRAGLESVGIRHVGALIGAPRAPLVRRFGTMLVARLDQAIGLAEEVISPRLPVSPLSAERRLPEPIGMTEDIERLILLLAGTLRQELERRDEGARRLSLSLFRVDGAVMRLGVGASRPLREPPVILQLFREKLAALEGKLDAGYGFDMVRLSAAVTAPFTARQTDLSGSALQEAEAISLLADRIRARLGKGAILVPSLRESHVPERAVRLVPFGEEALAGGSMPARNDAPPGKIRPIRLLETPEPVEASAEVPEGPPLSFRWRRALYRVARAEGPERIAPEWWQEDREAPTRDYFCVEDVEGRRYWLFREGLYGEVASPRWFLHGIFP